MKWFYLEPEMVPSSASYMELQNGSRTIFLVKGSIGQVWDPMVL